MEWTQVKAKWSQLRGKARETWGRLTDDDLDVIRGKRDLLVGKLIAVYGLAKEEAERQASGFAKDAAAAAGRAKFSAKKAAGAVKSAGRDALGNALDAAAAGLDRVRKNITPADGREKSGRSGRGATESSKRARKKSRPH